jgi:hypothetical protein
MKISKIIILLSLALLAFTTGDSKSEYILPRAAYSIYTGDIDLDADIDIVIGHNYNLQTSWSGISILKNQGNGYFNFIDSIFLFGWQPAVFIKNLNNNPLPEIIAKKEDAVEMTEFISIIYDNKLDSILNFNLNTYQGVGIINTGDFNGDNILDIVIASNSGKFWGVLYNDANGNFSLPVYYNTPEYNPGQICCGDLNSDGRDDIVISSAMKTEIFFSLENGFQSLSFNVPTNDIHAVDFDHDGDLDIISLDSPLSNFCRIIFYENLGIENFYIHPYFDFQPKGSYMTISDFNNDSLPDILLHTQDAENLLIFYNEGNFELSEFQLVPLINYGETIRKSTCADFDENGYTDIATIRYLYAPIINLNIYYNDGNGNFVENPIITETKETKTNNSQLFSCYPNPFHSEINLMFQLNESSFAEIFIHNLKGDLVKIITHQQEKGGKLLIKWDGLDDNCNICKPSPYLLTFKVNGIDCKFTKIIKY